MRLHYPLEFSNDISEVIRNFDLINSSPMDAINFISLLKNMLR